MRKFLERCFDDKDELSRSTVASGGGQATCTSLDTGTLALPIGFLLLCSPVTFSEWDFPLGLC